MYMLYFSKLRVHLMLLHVLATLVLSHPAATGTNESISTNQTIPTNQTSFWSDSVQKVKNIFVDPVERARILKDNPCYEFGCECVNTTDTITCDGSNFDDLVEASFQDFEPLNIKLTQVSIYHLNFTTLLTKFNKVKKLTFNKCRITDFVANGTFFTLKELDLDYNYIADFDSICSILEHFPHLEILSLNHNHVTALKECQHVSQFKILSITDNQIDTIKSLPSKNLRHLNVSNNNIKAIPISVFNLKLKKLSISNNPIHVLPDISAKSLVELEANNLLIEDIFFKNTPLLRTLSITNSHLYSLNFEKHDFRSLRTLNLNDSVWLSEIEGSAPKNIQEISISNSLVNNFPERFFADSQNVMLTITNSHFSCDSCFLKWTTPLKRFSLEEIKCTNVTKHDKCDVVIDQSGLPKDPDTGLNIRRAKIGGVAELPCYFTGSEVKAIEWRRVYPDQLIAYIPISELNKPKSKYQPNHYQVLPGGHLLVKDAKRELVERYKCNVIGLTHNASVILNFRLDFSQWYSTDVFNSVFWGACVCSLLTCLASFLFNITWIILKNVGLWWLNRAERLSRVKGMVDAMEKYRQRQMERIQERYHKNIENIRDNYHNQVETLRVSYANQTEKFKDFKQQRLENVSQHLEGIKDHYNQQVSRIKDFGSKRAEALCDSYEQQLTRVKAFTLQNRLKLMRQYKVKQKFINKLLERYNENEHNMDDADKVIFEEQLRRVFDLQEATLETVLEGGLEQTSKFVERSPSYYSLPEYVTGDDDSIVENTGYTSPNRHLAMNRCNLDVAGSSKSSKYSPISENPSSSGISSLKTKPYDSVSSSLLTDSTIDTFKARGSDKIKPRKKSASTCESEFSGSNTNENGKRIN